MNGIVAKEKFIAFVDILGFKSLVEKSEAGKGLPLSEIIALTKMLGGPEDREAILKDGCYTVCPESRKDSPDIDFQISQVSDCVVISTEISPAGAISIVSHCWKAAMGLLRKGVMVRGYITRGLIHHQGNDFIGTGYQQVVDKEKDGITAFKRTADEKGTPFIEIDRSVVDYINENDDGCIKKMFDRQAKGDGVVHAIFPFKALSHSFAIGGFGVSFDPEKEKRSNNAVRKWIFDFIDKIDAGTDKSNASATAKADHYISALKQQISICDDTDEFINNLCRPFPHRR